MFSNAIFETKFGKPRYKNFGLDMCLTSRSLIPRLVPFVWGGGWGGGGYKLSFSK